MEEMIKVVWKGRSGESPIFGRVYPGRILEMTESEFKQFENDVTPVMKEKTNKRKRR